MLDLARKTQMHVIHVTSVHPRHDIRIFIKECVTLKQAGYTVTLLVADGLGDAIDREIAIHDVGKCPQASRGLRMTHTVYRLFCAIRSRGLAIIHLHDPELLIMGLWLKKIGYPIIYDSHEDVPRQLLTKNWIPRMIRPLLSSAFAYFERYAIRRFDALVVTTSHLKKRFKTSGVPVALVRNYPLLTECLKTIPWSDRKDMACYIGSISTLRGMGILIDALELGATPLQLAGSWSEPMLREAMRQKPGWRWVIEQGLLDRAGIVHLLTTVKIGMVTLLPTPNHLVALPIKLFEYMAAGIPVIASDFPLWRAIVKKAQCGLCVDPHKAKAIAEAIRYLLNHPHIAYKMGQAGREAVLQKYNWESESKRLLALYHQLSRACVKAKLS